MRRFDLPGPPAPVYARPPPPQKKGRGCLFFVMMALGGTTLLCCCLGSALVAAGDGTPSNWDPVSVVAGPETPLGTALVPGDLDPASARAYRWRHVLERYSLGYGVSDEEHAGAEASLKQLARDFRYKSGVGNAFTWTPPARCQPQPWVCIFDELATANKADIEPLTELFRQRQQQQGLDARQVTELVVTFVQNITYRLPTEHVFGILPPTIVVADGSGDCDSKSLLTAMILESLGIDVVMLYSAPLEHAALAVAIPGSGDSFTYRGRKYLYVESTNPGWAIGTIPPEYNKPKLWEVLPFTLH